MHASRTRLGLVVAAAACLALTAPRPAHAVEYDEPFQGPALNALWETYLPSPGARVAFDAGGLRIDVPSGLAYDQGASVDHAPQVRMDAPQGDFTIETAVSLPDLPRGNYQSGLFVMFGRNDLFYWGFYQNPTQLRLQRSNGSASNPHTVFGEPLYLRITRTGNTYSFYYRNSLQDSWILGDRSATGSIPVKVGVLTRTWQGVHVAADFHYFNVAADHLQYDLSQGWIKAQVLSGATPATGPWLVVKDAQGNQVGGIAKAALKGVATVFNVPPGTYTVAAVHPWFDTIDQKTVVVIGGQETDVDLQVVPCPIYKLTSASRDVALLSAPGGWKLLPGPAGSSGDAKLIHYLGPAGETYDPSGADTTFGSTWLSNVRVPGDYGQGAIKDNSLFWYRLDLTLPDSNARFAGRPWVLDGYNIDDEDITYVNGSFVGSIRSKSTPNSWIAVRNYTLDPSIIHATGHNVIAILGFQGPGGAGMTSTGPELKTASNTINNVAMQVLGRDGQPADGLHVTVTSLGGAYSVSAMTSGGVGTVFSDLPAGQYLVSFDRPVGLDPSPPQLLTVTPGSSMGASFVVPTVPFQRLTSDVLDAAGLPSWNFMAIPAAEASKAAQDDAPADPAYVDLGQDKNYGEDWYADAPVPADLGWGDPAHPDKTLPIENNSYFWYRLHVAVPALWRAQTPGRDLLLTQFQVDDEDWTYFNGRLIGHTGTWTPVRTYEILNDGVHWGGDNVIAIKGHQLTGSAGIVGTAQFSLATKPRDDVGPAFEKGDVNGDGVVDLIDVALALRISVGALPGSPDAQTAGDLNHDGKIDIDDVVALLRAVTGVAPLP